MRRNKLRSFIIASIVVHFIVVFIFLLLFLPKNLITNPSSSTIPVGVISTNKGSNLTGINSLNSPTNETSKHVKTEDLSVRIKLKSFKKREEKTTNNPIIHKQQKKSLKKVNLESDDIKSMRQSKLSPKSDTKIEYNTSSHSRADAIEQNSDLHSSKISSIKKPNGEGTEIEALGRIVELAYPDYKVNPKPNYPMIARRRGYEGAVFLKVFVLESGSVGDIELERSSGHEILDESALDAVKDWIFIPGKKNGEPVSSWVTVPIKFQLNSG